MNRRKQHMMRVAAVVSLLSLLMLICVSQAFSCHTMDHQCLSEDCLICFVLSVHERLSQGITAVTASACVALVAAVFLLWERSHREKLPWQNPTLVTLRVELRD